MKIMRPDRPWRLAALPVLVCLALAAGPARAEDGMTDSYQVSSQTKQGNQSYHEGKYDQARAGYMRAKDRADEQSDEAYRLHYNIGATFYKEGNYEEAEKEFTQSAAATDPALQESAYYNLGNVYFKQGEQAKDIKLLQKAIEQYQKALEINPDNQDAKFNIEVVRRLIQLQKQPPEPQPPPPEDQPPDQDQKDQKDQKEQEDQDKPEDQSKEQDQKDKPEEDQPQPNQPPPAGSQPEPQDGGTGQSPPPPQTAGGTTVDPNGQKPPQPMTPEGSAQKPGEMSKEEAEMLLQAVEQREKEDLKRVIDARAPEGGGKEKDW